MITKTAFVNTPDGYQPVTRLEAGHWVVDAYGWPQQIRRLATRNVSNHIIVSGVYLLNHKVLADFTNLKYVVGLAKYDEAYRLAINPSAKVKWLLGAYDTLNDAGEKLGELSQRYNVPINTPNQREDNRKAAAKLLSHHFRYIKDPHTEGATSARNLVNGCLMKGRPIKVTYFPYSGTIYDIEIESILDVETP